MDQGEKGRGSMGRVIAFLAAVGIVASFLAGVLLAARVDPSPIVNARATQEAARGEQEQAKAAAAWARAHEAETHAEAVHASLPQMTLGLRALAVGLPAAVVLLALALALSAGWWAWRRAGMAQLAAVYPRGGVSPLLILEQNGRRFIVDAGRGLGSVTAIDPAGRVRLPLAGPADVHAQLSAQSLAAAVIAQAAGDKAKTEAAAAVGRAVQDALVSLPALAQSHAPKIVFSATPKPADGQLRVIKRNVPTVSGDTVKTGHFCEYLRHGATIGYSRRAWAGKRFADGEICTQSLWAKLNAAARKANVLTDDGHKLRQPVDETLASLGLEDLGQ